MLLGTLKGILVATIVSPVALAYQVANPRVHVLGRKPGTNVFRTRSKEHPEDETPLIDPILLNSPCFTLALVPRKRLNRPLWVSVTGKSFLLSEHC